MLGYDLTSWMIILAGGFIAGAMNTLAGYGSIITLSILMELMGLPGNIANGTNRINVFTNTIGGVLGFARSGNVNLKRGKSIIILTSIGALVGIYIATQVSNEQFKSVFKYLVIVLFFLILVNPKRWLRELSEDHDQPLWKLALIFMPVGLYGGFIQMGMGFFFLAGSVLIAKYNLIHSNAMKLFTVMLYTLMSIAIFQYHGMIDWKAGLTLGISTFLGGYTTAHFAARSEKANLWAYRLLIVIVVLVVIKNWIL